MAELHTNDLVRTALAELYPLTPANLGDLIAAHAVDEPDAWYRDSISWYEDQGISLSGPKAYPDAVREYWNGGLWATGLANVRLMEDGTPKMTEDGSIRVLE